MSGGTGSWATPEGVEEAILVGRDRFEVAGKPGTLVVAVATVMTAWIALLGRHTLMHGRWMWPRRSGSPMPDDRPGGKEVAMSDRRVRRGNAAVWAVVMLADAVVLKGVDGSVFVTALLVLIVGAAGTDALLVRALPRDDPPGPPSDEAR